MLSMMLFWFVMMLLCCAIVSLRLAMSCTTSSNLVLALPRVGEMDSRSVGKGGSSSSVNCYALNDASACSGCDAVPLVLVCLSCGAVVCVLSACCFSSTFALGFLVRALGAASGGVDGVRLGVEVAIGGPARCPEGRRGRLAAGTS